MSSFNQLCTKTYSPEKPHVVCTTQHKTVPSSHMFCTVSLLVPPEMRRGQMTERVEREEKKRERERERERERKRRKREKKRGGINPALNPAACTKI